MLESKDLVNGNSANANAQTGTEVFLLLFAFERNVATDFHLMV